MTFKWKQKANKSWNGSHVVDSLYMLKNSKNIVEKRENWMRVKYSTRHIHVYELALPSVYWQWASTHSHTYNRTHEHMTKCQFYRPFISSFSLSIFTHSDVHVYNFPLFLFHSATNKRAVMSAMRRNSNGFVIRFNKEDNVCASCISKNVHVNVPIIRAFYHSKIIFLFSQYHSNTKQLLATPNFNS